MEQRGGDSSDRQGVSTSNGVVEVYENERLESDDDVELDDEPVRAQAGAASSTASAAAHLPTANASAASQISQRTRKKYQLSPTDLEQLGDVFVSSSVITSPRSDDDAATADYRRFCLGTLGALGPLEQLSEDDDQDDEEYYYLHDEDYARGADFSVSEVDDDEFDESRDQVSEDELHDLLADKKRVHSSHPREPKAKKQAVLTQPFIEPVAASLAAAATGTDACPEAAPVGIPASSARTAYAGVQSHTTVVSSGQIALIRQQIRQHVQLCAQVLVVSTHQHGPAVDRSQLQHQPAPSVQLMLR
jgi:hypothetical protein